MTATAAATPTTAEKKTRNKETIQRQIHTNAVKYLTEQANKKYEADKTKPYEPPSEAAIKAECQRRWLEHQDRKNGKEDISRFFA